MRVAVVGHVEWVRFLAVDGPPSPGAILRAPGGFLQPAGGGAVAAAELARHEGSALLVTALGEDALGQAISGSMASCGVEVVGPTRAEPHRQAITLVDPDGERTIIVVGPAQGARAEEIDPHLFRGLDAVYFCKGDAALLRLARQARVLVGTARVLDTLRESGVRLDALVRSGRDPSEVYAEGDLPTPPDLVATTDGARGGAWSTTEAAGTWQATPLPGPLVDAYGAGDCFAVGLTLGLARGLAPQEAVELGARCGAGALTRKGAGTIDVSG